MTRAHPSTLIGWARAVVGRREVRFLLAGAYNTVFGYLAFLGIYWSFGEVCGASICLFISYLPSLVSAYLVQKYFVFHPAGWLPADWVMGDSMDVAPPSGNPYAEFLRFTAVNTSVMLINLLFLPLAIRNFGMAPPMAQAVFLSLAVIASYFAHRYFSFRARPHR